MDVAAQPVQIQFALRQLDQVLQRDVFPTALHVGAAAVHLHKILPGTDGVVGFELREEVCGTPVDRPADDFRRVAGVHDDKLVAADPGDGQRVRVGGGQPVGNQADEILGFVHAEVFIDIVVAVDAVDGKRQRAHMVASLGRVFLKPAGEAFQVVQSRGRIRVQRAVQVTDQQLLAGVAQVNRKDKVQHVRQAFDQLGVVVQIRRMGGIETADDCSRMQRVEQGHARFEPFLRTKFTEPALREDRTLIPFPVRNIQQLFLNAVRDIVHARIDAQETPVQADIGIRQDGGRNRLQEGFRILLDEQLRHRMIQVVFMIVQCFAPAVDGQRVIAFVLRGRAAAGFREDRPEGMGNGIWWMLSGFQPADQVHDGHGKGTGVVAAGAQAGSGHVSGRHSVKAGDDHVVRDLEPCFLQRIAHGDRHEIVGTENGVRQFAPGQDQPPDDIGRGRGPEIAVGEHVRIEREAVFLQHFPPALHPAFGIRLALYSGDIESIFRAVVTDDMAQEFLVTFLIVVDNGPAAGQFHTGQEDRYIMRFRAVRDFPDQVIVMKSVADENKRVEQVVPDRAEPGTGDPVFSLVPVEIQGSIKNDHTKAFSFADAAQLVQESRIQKIMNLRKADGDEFLPVSHKAGPPVAMIHVNDCTLLRQSITQKNKKAKNDKKVSLEPAGELWYIPMARPRAVSSRPSSP